MIKPWMAIANGRRRRSATASLLALALAGLAVVAPGAFADYRSQVMSDGPASYFRMDDSDSTMLNEVASASNGTHLNDPLLGGVGALDNAPPNRAVIYFADPDQDRSRFPVSSYSQFSLEYFVYTGQAGTPGANQWYDGFGLVDGEISSETNDAGTALIHDGLVGFGMGAPDTTIASTTPINDSAWHHVVATANGSGVMKLYVDGVLEAQANAGPTGSRSNSGFSIGALDTNFLHAAAAIDEVAFYSSELTATDVAEH